MSISLLRVLALALALGTVHAIYEEQVGQFDWYKQQIGEVNFAAFPTSKNKVYVATARNTIAALRTSNGAIGWRQVLSESDNIDDFVYTEQEKSILTASSDCRMIRRWAAQDGSLLWEVKLSASLPPAAKGAFDPQQLATFLRYKHANAIASSTSEQACSIATFAPVRKTAKGHVVVLSESSVYALDGSNGEVLWRWTAPKEENAFMPVSVHVSKTDPKASKVQVLGLMSSSGDAKLITLHPKSGEIISDATGSIVSSDPTHNSVLIRSDQPLFVSLVGAGGGRLDDISSASLYVFDGASEADGSVLLTDLVPGFASLKDLNSLRISATGSGHIAIASSSHSALVAIKSTSPVKFEVLDSSQTDVALYDSDVSSFVRVSVSKAALLATVKTAEGHSLEARSEFGNHGAPRRVFFHTALTKEKDSKYRVLVVGQDHSLNYVELHGDSSTVRSAWTREEALASVSQAHMIDVPVKSAFSGSFPSIFQRVGPQVGSLITYLQSIVGKATSLIDEVREKIEFGIFTPRAVKLSDNENEAFGYNKLILLVTDANKVFGIDSVSGEIVWSFLLDTATDDRAECAATGYNHQLHVTHAHGHSAVIVSRPKRGSDGPRPLSKSYTSTRWIRAGPDCPTVVFNLNALEGIVTQREALSYKVLQSVQLPFQTEHHQRILLFIAPNDQVFVHPNSPAAVALVRQHTDSVFFHRVELSESRVQGYGLTKGDNESSFRAVQTWEVVFPSDVEMISDYCMPRHDEPIKSAIRSIAENNVHEKYLNPNMIAVATVRTAPSGGRRLVPSMKRHTDPSVNVYLIDSVSGTILSKVVHRNSEGPVHMVLTENTVVYHYFNIKQNQYEVSVMELYEEPNDDPTATPSDEVSSFTRPPFSRKQQTYVLSSGLRALAVTTTRLGIASKQFLFGLLSDQILSVTKQFLDPHRPTGTDTETMTKAKEAGLVPYAMDLPDTKHNVLTYYNQVANLRNIVTTQASLESTSLVFAFGVDLFYSRVFPSTPFDLLSEEFNAPFLIFTVSAVVAAVVLTRVWARNKELKQAWA